MSWVIARKPDGEVPIVGKEYEIRDSRHGTYSGRILNVRGAWAAVEVTQGQPRFASLGHKVSYNGTVTIRDSLVYLIEIESHE